MSTKTKPQRIRYRAEQKFARFAALNGLIDEGGEFAKAGRKAKAKLNDTWQHRSHGNAGTMYKARNAAPGPVVCRG